MDTKIIGIILLTCAALIFQYSYDGFISAFFSPEVKLKTTIEKDINTSLTQESNETKSSIHHVKFIYRSADALSFLKRYPPQIQTNKEGTIWLEVEVLDLQDNEKPGFITQISVFDISSRNKISEFGQTYYFEDFDKQYKTNASLPKSNSNSMAEIENNEANQDPSERGSTNNEEINSEDKKETAKPTK